MSDYSAETLRISKTTKFITFEISSRNKKSFKKLIKISFKLSKNSSKNQFKNKSKSLNSIFLIFSQNSLQKLKNQRSKIFKNHKESIQFIIFSFVNNESEMTDQHQKKRFDKDIQDMIQAIIREMISEIIQQNVIAATTINVALTLNAFLNRLNSSQHQKQSQMTFRFISES